MINLSPIFSSLAGVALAFAMAATAGEAKTFQTYTEQNLEASSCKVVNRTTTHKVLNSEITINSQEIVCD